MAMKGAEQATQDAIRVKLAQAGYVVFRTNVGKVKTADGRWFDSGLPTGFPDLVGYKPENGRIFFIEVKTKTGKPRADQIKFHLLLQEHGVTHGICRSPEDAIKVVKEGLIGYGY